MNTIKLEELFHKPFYNADFFQYWYYRRGIDDKPVDDSIKKSFLLLYKNYNTFINHERQTMDVSIVYARPSNTLFPTKKERLSLRNMVISLVDLYKELDDPHVKNLMTIYALEYFLKLDSDTQLKYQKNKKDNLFDDILSFALNKGEFNENLNRLDFYLKISPLLPIHDNELRVDTNSSGKNEVVTFFESVKSFSKHMNKLFHIDVLINDMLQEYQNKYSSFADFIYTTSSNCIYLLNDKNYSVQSIYLNPSEFKINDYKTICPNQSPLIQNLLSTVLHFDKVVKDYHFKPIIPFEETNSTNNDIEDERTYNGVYLLLARAIEVSFKRRLIENYKENLDNYLYESLLRSQPLVYLMFLHPMGNLEEILFDSKKPILSYLSTLYALPQMEKNIDIINSHDFDIVYEVDNDMPLFSKSIMNFTYQNLTLLNELKDEKKLTTTKHMQSKAYDILFNYEREKNKDIFDSLRKKLANLDQENQKSEKTITTLKNNNKQLNKRLNEELKEKRKLLSDSSLLRGKQALEKQLLQKQNELEKVQLSTEEQIRKLEARYTQDISKLQSDKEFEQKKSNELINELKIQVKSLSEKNHELLSNAKKSIAEPTLNKKVVFEEWLEQGKFLLESPNKEDYQHQILNLIKNYMNINVPSVVVKESFSNRFGYVLLEGQDTYVVFADGSKMELTEIPNDTFLSDYQFVRVGKDGKYLYMYYYSYSERFKDKLVQEYGVVESIEGNMLTILGLNNTLYKVTHDSSKMKKFKINTIVGYKCTTDTIEILRVYDRLYSNLDVIYNAILQKGLNAYIYVKAISNGIIVMNTTTNQEEFIFVKENEEHPISNLREGEVLILNGNEGNSIVRTFHPNYYRFSSIYPHSQVALINRIDTDNRIFVEKQNNEIVLMKNVSSQTVLNIGDSVMIDENNEFLQNYNYFKYNKETLEKRLASRSANTKSNREKTELPPITKKIAIVGNPKYSINTKLILRKYGYEATTIDGFSTYSNAKMIAKNFEVVVVVPSYASHDNFWSFKDEFTQAYPHIEVLFATKDGANFIASLISGLEEKELNTL